MPTPHDTSNCPKCGGDLIVRETLKVMIADVGVMMRRKVCKACDHRIKTAEVPFEVAVDVWQGSV